MPPPTPTPTPWSGDEIEPNDDYDHATTVLIPGLATGEIISPPQDIDYFVMDTGVGPEYVADLTIESLQDLSLRLKLHHGNRYVLKSSPPSTCSTSLSWKAYESSYYLSVEADALGPSTLQWATYRLSVHRRMFHMYLPVVLRGFHRGLPTPTPTSTPTSTAIASDLSMWSPVRGIGRPNTS